MVAPVLAGLGLAARALLRTPAGQRAIARGSKAVERFLRRNDPGAFKPTDAQVTAGKKLQKTMKKRRLVKNIKVGAGAGAAGAIAGRASNKTDALLSEKQTPESNLQRARDLDDEARRKAYDKHFTRSFYKGAGAARAVGVPPQRKKAAATKKRRQEISQEAATLLNKGGFIKSRKTSIDGPIVRKGHTRAPHR